MLERAGLSLEPACNDLQWNLRTDKWLGGPGTSIWGLRSTASAGKCWQSPWQCMLLQRSGALCASVCPHRKGVFRDGLLLIAGIRRDMAARVVILQPLSCKRRAEG